MTAKELITTYVIPLKPSDTGAFALIQMEEFGLAHLPVVEGKELVGVISDKDIQTFDEPEVAISQYLLTTNIASVSSGQHFYEVLNLFSSLQLTMLPVVGDNNLYLGAIMLPAVVHSLAEMAGISHPGGIIILEMNFKDYSLSEIVQIVESNDIKILSCFVTSQPDSTVLEVTLKVDHNEIAPLLQAFFRLNYTVKASWSKEDSYHDGLQDRFDALMNYLNI
jgi:acetoin utilization protein AcuB